jgi:hypothetical protein
MSTTNETPRRARLLTRLRINEVSAVDRGAGEGVKIVLMKRDDEPPPDARSMGPLEKWERAQRRLIKARERGAALFKQYLAKADKPADKTPPPVDPALTDHVDRRHGKGIEFDLADGTHMKFRNERALAEWLAIQSRIKKSNQEESSMTHDSWQNIAKDHGVIAVAKFIVEDGAHGLGEHEFTKLVTEHAQRAHPGLSAAAAFEKLFTAQTEEGMLLRQACAACKAWPAPISIEPTMEGGSDAFPTVTRRPGSSGGRKTSPEDGLGTAYEQLTRLAEQQRRDGETAAAAFMRVYTDPANASLAEAERAQNRPAGGVRIVE